MTTSLSARALLPAVLAGLVGIAFLATGHAQEAKKEGAKKVTEGQTAPDVELPAANAEQGKTLKLKDYRGKKNVVLFFYPKAATRG